MQKETVSYEVNLLFFIILQEEESYDVRHIVKEKGHFMKHRQSHNILLLLLIFSIFTEVWMVKIVSDSRRERLSLATIQSTAYRAQNIGEELLKYVENREKPATEVGLYLLESKFGYQSFPYDYNQGQFQKLKQKWKHEENWNTYDRYTKAIWNDVKYFPVPESTIDATLEVNFTNSWMNERTYGGKRGHEGTDIMAKKNVPGMYPVVSMTDGIVQNKGWLEKGGYRIGVLAPSGAYFYYAHLHSYADVKIGDEIPAGTLLGFMGDSGYGSEGTTGKFPVHLHVGIYLYPNGEEMSVNPYWILRYLEKRQIKSSYSLEI